jgi:hypothetical protein
MRTNRQAKPPSRQLPINKQYRAGMSPLSHQESSTPLEARRNTKSLTEVFGWMWPLPHMRLSVNLGTDCEKPGY